ncbi:MAG: tRNA-dihydrouridine synthase [Deltaproteobacteria bacterium]|nr:tRNA-dihydrouridine synthase [Deltaproteobacteria bacterium]
MAELATTLAGKKVRSAIGLSSVTGLNFSWHPASPVDTYTDWFKRWIDAGIGFIVMPSVGIAQKPFYNTTEEIQCYREALWRAQFKAKGSKGDYTYYFTTGAVPTPNMDHGIKRLEQIKKIAPSDVPIIASLFPPVSPEENADMAKRFESAGADMIEINGGCPIDPMSRKLGQAVAPGEEFGMFLGCSTLYIKPIVEAVTRAVKIPVGVKMTPQAGYPGMLAVINSSIEAGAKYIQTTHTPMGILPPDIYNDGKGSWPLLKEIGANPIATVGGGEAVRIHNFFYTAMASAFFSGKIDVVGSGGIVDGEHAIQSIMLGAGTVTIASAFIWRGISYLRKISQFISDYMDNYGYRTIQDLRGKALQYIKPWPEIVEQARQLKLVARVELSKCTGCGICADNLCNAVHMEDGFSMIDEDDCSACGLCQMCCPVGAISLVPCDKSLAERIQINL